MKDRLRRSYRHFANTDRVKQLLVLLGALYVLIAFLPKHGDYWITLNVSKAFALDPARFMVGKTWQSVGYPPSFYALQGTWLRLGSSLFHYDLAANSDLTNPTFFSYGQTSLGIFPFWGMIPILTALFLLAEIAYKELHNKWVALICFGPITFVAVVIMGQIDVVCALFIFISLILIQRALHTEKVLFCLLLGYLALGVSMQFKTYGGLLLPAYMIYTLALVRDRKIDRSKSLVTLVLCLATFLVAMFIVWAPYPGWFNTIILQGPSNNLLQHPSLVFQAFQAHLPAPLKSAPIWLLGYVVILCYMAARVLGNPKKYFQDDRYFIFYNFTIIAWFFIAVFTHPQWWMFLVPAALLTLDNFKNKAGTIACIFILIAYPLYPMYWGAIVAVFTSYHIPAAVLTGTPSTLVSAVLAGLLVFWIFASKRELDHTGA